MTTSGAEPPAQPGPEEDAAALDRALDWDHPLTRLLLLLEIADEPDWLRDLVPPATHTGRVAASARQSPG